MLQFSGICPPITIQIGYAAEGRLRSRYPRMVRVDMDTRGSSLLEYEASATVHVERIPRLVLEAEVT